LIYWGRALPVRGFMTIDDITNHSNATFEIDDGYFDNPPLFLRPPTLDSDINDDTSTIKGNNDDDDDSPIPLSTY
jgi:hypothetical protein